MDYKNAKKFYVGFDIGESIGFSVTDENFNVIERNGKRLMGVNIGKTPETAQNRRLFRSARRVRAKEKARLKSLKEMFEALLETQDPGYLARVNNSNLINSHKLNLVDGKGIHFANVEDESKFNKKFPTIYHSISYLKQFDEEDPIHLYRVLSWMMKNRGHFITPDVSVENIGNVIDTLNRLNENLIGFSNNGKEIEKENTIDSVKLEEFARNSYKNKLSHTQRKKEAIKELKLIKGSVFRGLVELLFSGGSATLKSLSIDFDDALEEELKTKVNFGAEDIISEFEKLDFLTESEKDLLMNYKEVYDEFKFLELMSGRDSITEVMISIYDQHRDDLELLKKVSKTYLNRSEYDFLFRSDEPGSYNYYLRVHKVDKDKTPHDLLIRAISKLFENVSEENQSRDLTNLMKKVKEKDLLPRVLNKNNVYIPKQAIEKELLEILNKQNQTLRKLSKINKTTINETKEQIINIFNFKSEYFIGPLNTKSERAWLVKKEGMENIPFDPKKNIYDLIDIEKTTKNFKEKLILKDDYFGEAVLPKYSVAYSKYLVWSYLNNIRVDGNRIEKDLRRSIYEEVIMGSKGTLKEIEKRIKKEYSIEIGEITTSGDKPQDIMRPYKTIMGILEGKKGYDNINSIEEAIDKVVEIKSLYDSNYFLVKKAIDEEFKDVLNDKERNLLISMNIEGWGRLSKSLLQRNFLTDHGTGELTNVLEIMENTGLNLEEIKHSSLYNFNEVIDNKKDFKNFKKSRGYIYSRNLPPRVESVSLRFAAIYEELLKILKIKNFDKVFIESTRWDSADKNKTPSRQKKLKSILNNFSGTNKELLNMLDKLTDENLRREKLYLWFLQNGQCAYSGRAISFEDLNQRVTDVDHIIPKSRMYVDDLDNKVLVYAEYNQDKSNAYPLSEWDPAVQQKMQPLWKVWLDNNMISSIKYSRLVRKEKLTDEELLGFVNRDLNSTSYTSNVVRDVVNFIADKTKTKTDVQFVKPAFNGRLRQGLGWAKMRELNNHHHAHDAYLTVVSGVCLDDQFGWFKGKKYRDSKRFKNYNFSKVFDKLLKDEEKMNVIMRDLKSNEILISYKRDHGNKVMHEDTILPAGHKKIKVHLGGNLSDTNIYGGKTGRVTAGFYLMRNKKTKKLRLETRYNIDHSYDYDFIRKIPIDTVLILEGKKYLIRGSNEKQIEYKKTEEFILDNKMQKYLKSMLTGNFEINQHKDVVLINRIGKLLSSDKMPETYNKFYNENFHIYKEAFLEGDEEEKRYLISEILKSIGSQSGVSNFKKINLSEETFRIKVTKNIKGQISVIENSITGFHKKVYKYK